MSTVSCSNGRPLVRALRRPRGDPARSDFVGCGARLRRSRAARTSPLGLQIFRFLYALVAFWALFAIVAVYYRVRSVGEAWAFFATLVGVAASVGTMVTAMYEVANLRQNPPLAGASATDPLGIMSFGLTGLWFLVANLLLWRTRTPRVLALLGLVAAADLFAGFVTGLSENRGVVYLTSLIAGAIGGPI